MNENGNNPPSSGIAFGEDPKPYILAVLALMFLEFFRRAFLGYVPNDFTAYISAADAFSMGLNPYTQARELVPRYSGYPYNYLPGSLYFLQALSYFSTPFLLAVDWVLRCFCLIATVRIFHRDMFPQLRLSFIILVVLLFQPLNVDLLFGNVVTYLFTAFVVSYSLAKRQGNAKLDYLFIFLIGVLISLKPFWSIPVGFLFLSLQRYRFLGAFLAGFLVIPLLSLNLLDWMPSWFEQTSKMRRFYVSVDFLSLSPVLLGATWILGSGIALWFLSKQQQTQTHTTRWVWLLGCVSLPMWPRLATYSYVICLPLVLFFCQRWGWKKGLAFGFVLGPMGWILRVLPWLPNTQEEQWAYFIWIFIAAYFLIRELNRDLSQAGTNHR